MYQKWSKSTVAVKVSTCEIPHYLVLILVINFVILMELPMQNSGDMYEVYCTSTQQIHTGLTFVFFLFF